MSATPLLDGSARVGGPPSPPPVRRLPPVSVVAGALLVLAIAVVCAAARWSGELPVGSDHDEYLLVGERLRRGDGPLVAGVEGSKYPLGYPLVLALLGLLRLPVEQSAMVVNGVALVAAAAVSALTVRRLGLPRLGAFTAAVYVAASPLLWGSAYVVMADVLLVLLVALTLFVLVGAERGRDVLVLGALVAAATALKSVGLLLALGVSAGLLLRPGLRRWCVLPVVAGLAATVVSARAVTAYPEHTTGYGATFWLVDPRDASLGEASAADVLARLWTRSDVWLSDLTHALTGPHAPSRVALVVGLALLGLGLVAVARGRGRAFWPVLGFVGAYDAGLLLWPYASPRFGEPLIPVAALGVGLLGALLWRARVAGVLVALVAALAYTGWSVQRLAEEAALDREQYGSLRVALDEFEAWADSNVRRDEQLVSFDYREVARRLDRTVLPLGYTSDVAALHAASVGRGADWLVVVRDLYPRRQELADAVVTAYPDEFELALENARVRVYRVTG